MKIISHRGFWGEAREKNSYEAFVYSFAAGFGTETDVRDFNGDLVISHDIPVGVEMGLIDFLSLLDGSDGLTIALNIKSDGLACRLANIMSGFPGVDWFVFDMSVPDQRAHISEGNPVFTRLSEVERLPVWVSESAGVWLDAFYGEWYDNDLIQALLNQGKRVCIVSPELHGRNPEGLWTQILEISNSPLLILCTDRPAEAMAFFGRAR